MFSLLQVKVVLRVVSNNYHGDNAASFLNLDTRNKQVTVYDPAASGYATSVAHRKAAMAPKMFAFDGVCSPDDCLVCCLIVWSISYRHLLNSFKTDHAYIYNKQLVSTGLVLGHAKANFL